MISATPRALELEIVERARVWRAAPEPAKRGAAEALAEVLDEYERVQLRIEAERVARARVG